MISESDVRAAKDKNVLLEITARQGHSLTNGHVARLAEKIGTNMIINTDTHAPGDLIDSELAKLVIRGAGLDAGCFEKMQNNATELIASL